MMSKKQRGGIGGWARLNALGFETYAAYLRSPHWKAFRTSYVASSRPMTCVCCGSEKGQLHHQTYRRLGCEELDDVFPLCSPCHQELHLWLKNREYSVQDSREAVAAMHGDVSRVPVFNTDIPSLPKQAARAQPKKKRKESREERARRREERRKRRAARSMQKRLEWEHQVRASVDARAWRCQKDLSLVADRLRLLSKAAVDDLDETLRVAWPLVRGLLVCEQDRILLNPLMRETLRQAAPLVREGKIDREELLCLLRAEQRLAVMELVWKAESACSLEDGAVESKEGSPDSEGMPWPKSKGVAGAEGCS